ncbi:hypothetical protein LTR56_009675 [Elasticomyces elasticus]|nr:hypothetical protein LTR56_009675 [Elasticomyces elasticus]KAK3660175.1 hypothetical protein LTR22_008182 [Elasticomyces elasticus]KAK4923480.1 hypothetical protein LTR49_009354 [Elasticomyces elasticus]KAK5752439.1 hypothetical protein LTS12_017475 [Elasticomyces elasticus]
MTTSSPELLAVKPAHIHNHNESNMAIDRFIDIMRTRETRYIHEYISFTKRFTLLPVTTSLAHEGLIGNLHTRFKTQISNYEIAMKNYLPLEQDERLGTVSTFNSLVQTGTGGGDVDADEEEKAYRVKLFRSVKAKGSGCGQIAVHNDVKHPNLAWQFGRSAEYDHHYTLTIVPSSFRRITRSRVWLLSISRTMLVLLLPLLIGPEIPAPWQALDGQAVTRVDTGGVLRNADGTMKKCEFTIPVCAFLPPQEDGGPAADPPMALDMEHLYEGLYEADMADARVWQRSAGLRATLS